MQPPVTAVPPPSNTEQFTRWHPVSVHYIAGYTILNFTNDIVIFRAP